LKYDLLLRLISKLQEIPGKATKNRQNAPPKGRIMDKTGMSGEKCRLNSKIVYFLSALPGILWRV
jgi:hypothetical protein